MSAAHIPSEPEYITLGRRMARWLRDRYGADAERMIPACMAMAQRNVSQLQIDTVEMAERFLAVIKERGQ